MVSNDERALIAEFMQHWGTPCFHIYTVDVPLNGPYKLHLTEDWDGFWFIRDLALLTPTGSVKYADGITDRAGLQITSDLGMFSQFDFNNDGSFRRTQLTDGMIHSGVIRTEWFCQEPSAGITGTLRWMRAVPY